MLRFFESSHMPGKTVEFISQPELPSDIRVAVRWRQRGDTSLRGPEMGRERERREGRELIRDAIKEYLGEGHLTIRTETGGKPYARLDGQPVHISISHNPLMICGVISRHRIVGVDLESVRREVHPGLKERITHPAESDAVRDLSAIQLWTLKEAALKWCGSGLRTAMNRLCVVNGQAPNFQLELPDQRAVTLCSLRYQDHWLTVAYGSEEK